MCRSLLQRYAYICVHIDIHIRIIIKKKKSMGENNSIVEILVYC